MMKQKINMGVDTTALDQEIANYEKQLRQCYSNKDAIMADLDALDYEDKHFRRRKQDLEDRLYRTYDKIEEVEDFLTDARTKRMAILAEKISAENVYKTLVFFDELYDKMSDKEKRAFYEKIIKEVNVHEERQPNGQWLKSIVLRLPLIEHNMTIRLDNGSYVETVVLMSKKDK